MTEHLHCRSSRLGRLRTDHLLSDGHQVLIRPIEPRDKAQLALGLTELSAATVQRRFLSPKRRFTTAELRYLTEVDGHDHVAFVAEALSERRAGRPAIGRAPNDAIRPGRVVAVARWVRLPEDAGTADVAVVVADPLQRRGLGSLLAERLAETAAAHGIERFSATMLSDNRAAQALMASLSRRLERRYHGLGQSELLVELAA